MKWTAWGRFSAPAGALEQKAAVMKSVCVWGGSIRRDEVGASCHRGHVRAIRGVKAQGCRGNHFFLEFHFHFTKPTFNRADTL